MGAERRQGGKEGEREGGRGWKWERWKGREGKGREKEGRGGKRKEHSPVSMTIPRQGRRSAVEKRAGALPAVFAKTPVLRNLLMCIFTQLINT